MVNKMQETLQMSSYITYYTHCEWKIKMTMQEIMKKCCGPALAFSVGETQKMQEKLQLVRRQIAGWGGGWRMWSDKDARIDNTSHALGYASVEGLSSSQGRKQQNSSSKQGRGKSGESREQSSRTSSVRSGVSQRDSLFTILPQTW